MAGGLGHSNKIFVVRYYDKYGIAHNHPYARLDNAKIRFEEEKKKNDKVTLKCKRGLKIIG